jgi:hypothetical protein
VHYFVSAALFIYDFVNLDWETSMAGSFTVVYLITEEANITGLVPRHRVPPTAAICIGVGRPVNGMHCLT